jgi:hypothetical protein
LAVNSHDREIGKGIFADKLAPQFPSIRKDDTY